MKLETINKQLKDAKFSCNYLKTKGIFKNSRGTFFLDLVNEKGYSYNWWKLFDKINGIYVLNSYNYSISTTGHIRKARKILDYFKYNYIEVEALQGLSSTASIEAYYYIRLARARVNLKYARKKEMWNKIINDSDGNCEKYFRIV